MFVHAFCLEEESVAATLSKPPLPHLNSFVFVSRFKKWRDGSRRSKINSRTCKRPWSPSNRMCFRPRRPPETSPRLFKKTWRSWLRRLRPCAQTATARWQTNASRRCPTTSAARRAPPSPCRHSCSARRRTTDAPWKPCRQSCSSCSKASKRCYKTDSK